MDVGDPVFQFQNWSSSGGDLSCLGSPSWEVMRGAYMPTPDLRRFLGPEPYLCPGGSYEPHTLQEHRSA